MATDMLLRVRFAGIDGLSGILDKMSGGAKRAARDVGATNRSLREQKDALRLVERELAAGAGDTHALEERQRQLKTQIEGTNGQLDRQRKLLRIDGLAAKASRIGHDMVGRGQMALLSTQMVAAPLMAMAREAGTFESFRNRMKVLGLGDGATNDLTAFAKAMGIAGSSVNENMRYLLEAQGVFRESGEHSLVQQLAGAKLMGPLLARMHVAMGAMGQEMEEEQERYFLRFVEQAGGLSSPRKAAQLADGLFRALQSSGGNVQASNYQSFLAHAGVAGNHLSQRSMFADFEPLIAELHDQAGTGLATGMKMATGIKANSRAAAEYLKLGLWDRSKVTFNSLGGVKSTNGNPLTAPAAAALAHSPVDFYKDFILPAYQRAGIVTPEQRAFENAKIFGGTGGNLFSLIDKQLPTIIKSRAAFARTQGLNKAYDDTNNSFFGEQGKLRAAGKDFMVAAGTKGGLLDQMTGLMNGATKALRGFTAFGEAHPTAFKWIGRIVTDLLLLRVGLAVARIAFGGLLGPAARLWGVFAKIKAAGSFAAAFPKAAGLLRTLGGAFTFLGRTALRAGAMMLANPMALAVTAIVVAIGVASYLIYRNWDKIKAAFAAGWQYLKDLSAKFRAIGSMMMEGLLSMLDPSRLASHLVNLGKSAIGAFKGVLGIKSPSRVFAEIGRHTMAGMAIGLDRGVSGPLGRLRAAGRALAITAAGTTLAMPVAAATVPTASPLAKHAALGRAVIPTGITRAMPIAAAAAVPQAAPLSVYVAPVRASGATGPRAEAPPTALPPIIVNVDARGARSPDEIGRAVRRELEAWQRDQARAGRASYRDED